MRKFLTAMAIFTGLSLAGSRDAAFANASAQAAARPAPASAADLLRRVDIPYETFTLANGLRVIVHEDRKAPIVAVSVWYNVGSKDEPPGRTGFAHLFEHLMFNGSENTSEGVTPAELNRTVLGNTRQLPGQFETASAVLGALRSNALYRRPDNYWETVADRYRAMTASSLDQAARQAINPNDWVWVVVGDAARVRPQLERLGLPVEVVAPR